MIYGKTTLSFNIFVEEAHQKDLTENIGNNILRTFCKRRSDLLLKSAQNSQLFPFKYINIFFPSFKNMSGQILFLKSLVGAGNN